MRQRSRRGDSVEEVYYVVTPGGLQPLDVMAADSLSLSLSL